MGTNDASRLASRVISDGLVVLENVFDQEYCDKYKKILDDILSSRIDSNSYCGNNENQVLDNYFLDNHSLLNLIYQDITDKVMRLLIDDDYVLISPSARNRRILDIKQFGKPTSGHGWHTDSRFIQSGKGLNPSLCYMTIICIEDFGADNGATHYIPKSHSLYKRPEDRDADLEFEIISAKKGSLVIFDTALWHRIGPVSSKSRWGVFNTYGPWFMKPYHRFYDMFNQEESSKFPQIIRQLLHFNSITPLDHNERMATLRRVGL